MRAKRRPLKLTERRKLALGVLRRIEPGDTVETLSERMNLPPHRIQQALDEPRRLVLACMGWNQTADSIAIETGFPRAFVVLAMKREFAGRGSSREAQRATTFEEVERRTVLKRAKRIERGTKGRVKGREAEQIAKHLQKLHMDARPGAASVGDSGNHESWAHRRPSR